uniref:Granulins domain-containing protein n=1 Tax=Astatotilapia calliptera TaxID=8154 RepID=A0AAX7SP20_ASTCA
MGFLCLALLGLSSALVCPNGHTCQNKNTCCKNTEGGYGCCPLPRAECCSDHLHCCYEGTLCDLVHEKCVNKTVSLPWMTRLPTQPQAVVCPDQVSECPDDTTCCQLPDSSWGCCPLAKAVCCDDRRHCCPEATKCDIAHLRCVSASLESFPLLAKLPARRRGNNPASIGSSISCPDGKLSCPNAFTCCLLPSGEYGCCPYPKATCCEDHLHCCPANMECDLKHSRCRRGETVMPLMKKIPAVLLKVQRKVHSIPCNDSVACADGSTCCKTLKGDWACCPLPQAVCCDDHIHCCPHSKVCNLAAETCDDPRGFSPPVSWLTKVAALTLEVEDEKCDEKTRCPWGSTCCKMNSGQWACCPLPQNSFLVSFQAVCCNDHEHCCPKGYKCNVAEGTCDKPGGLSVAWLQKIPALQEELGQTVSHPTQNMCDTQTSCPRDTTCCFMEKEHKWGCCPLPNAVCCKDGNHCCPSGHTCEPHHFSCSRGSHVIPWFAKVSAVTEPGAVIDVKCDNKSSCASGTTCCKLKTGKWGCCPLFKAVCCTDHEHCCPQGYTCNMQTGTCEKQRHYHHLSTIPQIEVLQSVKEDEEDVACDGRGEFRCSKRDTCCKISTTEWSCCPSPRAVCCFDSKHCCPAGYSCDLKAGGCTLQTQLTWDSWFGDRKRDTVHHGL